VGVAVMAMGYIWIETLGRDLKDPFENRPNDISMTAISITIERDLLEILGETDLPEPVEPVKGVLM
jgi:ion channel-forming bestrophin family protein